MDLRWTRLVMARFHLARGKYCPHCRTRTTRARSPWFFRPFRILFRSRTSTRFCDRCGWWGLAFHR